MEERILEKLRKILALTSSPNEGEATAAAGHLQRLLVQYNLDIADLEKKGAAAPGVREAGHDLGKAAFKWKLDLAEEIAEHYYCHPLVNRVTKTVAFIGRPDNVESLQMLYAWLIDQIKRIATTERRAHFDATGEHIDPLRWQVSFGVGCVDRLGERLRELKARQEEDAAETELESRMTALVLSHKNEISDYLESKGLRRVDGQKTKAEKEREARWAAEDARLTALKETNLEAYYAERPWERPETPEQIAEREKRDAAYWKKEAAREARNRKKRENYVPTGGYREKRIDWRKEEQADSAREAGRKGADKVNLQPFLTEGKAANQRRIK